MKNIIKNRLKIIILILFTINLYKNNSGDNQIENMIKDFFNTFDIDYKKYKKSNKKKLEKLKKLKEKEEKINEEQKKLLKDNIYSFCKLLKNTSYSFYNLLKKLNKELNYKLYKELKEKKENEELLKDISYSFYKLLKCDNYYNYKKNKYYLLGEFYKFVQLENNILNSFDLINLSLREKFNNEKKTYR